MAISLNASRLMVREAARLMDVDSPQTAAWCAMAKAKACDDCYAVSFNLLRSATKLCRCMAVMGT
jgi:isobutyryl-CoA dehydrogenase